MAINGTTVYVSGAFIFLNSSTVTPIIRNRLAAISNNGAIGAWSSDVNTINVLSISNNIVYMGGAFTTSGGEARGIVIKLICI